MESLSGFPQLSDPENAWLMMDNPHKMDDWWVWYHVQNDQNAANTEVSNALTDYFQYCYFGP